MPYFKKPETIEQFFENVKFQFEGVQKYYADPTLLMETGIKAQMMAKDCQLLAEAISKKVVAEEQKS